MDFETNSLLLNNAAALVSKSELIVSQRYGDGIVMLFLVVLVADYIFSGCIYCRAKYMSCMASLERVNKMKKVIDDTLIPEYATGGRAVNNVSKLQLLEVAVEKLTHNVAVQTHSIGNLLLQYESMVRRVSVHIQMLSFIYILFLFACIDDQII